MTGVSGAHSFLLCGTGLKADGKFVFNKHFLKCISRNINEGKISPQDSLIVPNFGNNIWRSGINFC